MNLLTIERSLPLLPDIKDIIYGYLNLTNTKQYLIMCESGLDDRRKVIEIYLCDDEEKMFKKIDKIHDNYCHSEKYYYRECKKCSYCAWCDGCESRSKYTIIMNNKNYVWCGSIRFCEKHKYNKKHRIRTTYYNCPSSHHGEKFNIYWFEVGQLKDGIIRIV